MSNLYSWIYVDYENNIWKFSQNNNNELSYKIMYGAGKWTKESMIDKDVLGFTVYVEEDGKIHAVYSCTNGQIKYCTLKDSQWIGRILYLMDSSKYEIRNLKVNIIGDEMHLFYLLIEINASNRGVLIHSIWNGKETKTTKLLDITLIPDVKDNYTVNVDKESNIDVLFITDEENEITLNYCRYRNRRWTLVKRLYCIQGNDIGFEMLNDQQNIHILNKYKEGSSYYLDHVREEMNGEIQKFRVHESRLELTEPILFKSNDKLYSCWLEANRIYYSVFDGENWSGPTYYDRGNEYKVKRYHFYIVCDKEAPINEREIYGTGDIDLDLLFPSEFATEGKELRKDEENQGDGIQHYANQVEVPQKVEVLQNIKLRVYRERSENKQLKAEIDGLSAQVQKMQSLIDIQKEKISKILEQKQNTEENCDMFIELQQKMQKKLDYVNRRLVEEKNHKINMESKLKECEEESAALRQQLEKITEERNKLKKDLESEKGKSIVERFLKG